MAEQLLTVDEAAERLRCTPGAIHKRIWRRQIESIKSGRDRLIAESAIDAYCRRNTDKARR